MLTLGSVSREQASSTFDFLAPSFRGRRQSLRRFTHTAPELVFWIYPDGTLLDAKQAHRSNPPPGFAHILDDEPDYGGFLRGRIARHFEHQIIVVYCRSERLAEDPTTVRQLLTGLSQAPLPIDDEALVVSDNADIYGTVHDLWQRRT